MFSAFRLVALFATASAGLVAITPAQAQEGRADALASRAARSSLPSAAMLRFPNDAMLSFTACRKAISDGARPHDPVHIEMTMTGPVQRLSGGKRVAPLFVRIVYARQGGRETRKDHVVCTVNERGLATTIVPENR